MNVSRDAVAGLFSELKIDATDDDVHELWQLLVRLADSDAALFNTAQTVVSRADEPDRWTRREIAEKLDNDLDDIRAAIRALQRLAKTWPENANQAKHDLAGVVQW
jgi:hypothetical protein